MDKDYKKLKLNREQIKEAIVNFYNEKSIECEVGDFIDVGNRKRINIKAEDNFYLDVFFLNDGTTTLDYTGGRNIDEKIEICEYIKENCQIADKTEEHWFTVDGVSENDFNASMEVIFESEFYSETVKNPDDNSSDKQYQLKGTYGEKVTISRYHTGKVVLQGKHLMLFEEIVNILTTLVDYEEIPKLLNTSYKVSVNKDDIIEETKIIMKDSFDQLWTEKIKKSILQAVYNTNLDMDMFEYTMLVFPAYRALEGHLRYVIKNNGITLPDKNFYLFEPDGRLMQEYKDAIHAYHKDASKETKVISYLEGTYKYFADKRHIYFHWNKPNPTGMDQTRLVTDKGQAKALIYETLEYINNYFK